METGQGHRPRKRAFRLTPRELLSGVKIRLSLLILLTLVSMLALLGWAYYQRYQAERAHVLQAELEVAEGVAATFAAYIRDVQRQGATLGHASAAIGPRRTEEASRLLNAADVQYASVDGIYWTAPDGRILASSLPQAIGTSLGDRPYMRDIVDGKPWVISELLPTGRISGRPVFVIANGIRGQGGQLLGVMVMSIDPMQLGKLLLTQDRPGDATLTIFDHRGTLVYRRPEVELTWEERSRWRKEDPLLAQALKGENAAGETHPVIARTLSFGARVPIGEFGWVAGTTRPVETATAPIRKALIWDVLFSALVIATALGLATLIGRSIASPLRYLEDDVRAFGEGDLSHRAVLSGPREITQVATVFNRMADELQAYQQSLEDRVRERTAELEASNRELESFSYTVAHDLRSPLRALEGFSRYLLRHYQENVDERGKDYLNRINAAAQRMGRLIDDLLKMARISRETIRPEEIDLSMMAADIAADMQKREPQRMVEMKIASGLIVRGDRELLQVALSHLLENAWKFTGTKEHARITFDVTHDKGQNVYFVQDNGIGFDMAYADKLFLPFHRLQLEEIYSGTGMGLAIVQRIIARHGGRVWAEGREGQGATFYFTLGETL